jgi:hypothetical protein
LVMSVEEQFGSTDPVELLIAPMGEPEFRHASLLARELRTKGTVVEIAPEGKLKRSLELANKSARATPSLSARTKSNRAHTRSRT